MLASMLARFFQLRCGCVPFLLKRQPTQQSDIEVGSKPTPFLQVLDDDEAYPLVLSSVKGSRESQKISKKNQVGRHSAPHISILNDHIETPNTDLDQDTFGMVFCALARDTHFLSEDYHKRKLNLARVGRLCTTVTLLFFTVALQVAMLSNTKHYVSAKGVHDIRIAYGKFEEHIYQCHPNGLHKPLNASNCCFTKYGNVRGKKEAKPDLATQRTRLNAMDEEDQGNACRIPLSQPKFFALVLLVWTLTCLQELRKAKVLMIEIFKLETISRMKDCFEVRNDDGVDGDASGEKVIVGLTCCIKASVMLLQVVRVFITCALLYIGSRWLLSTNRFADLILNALALEFILGLKELIHATLAPARNTVELDMTKIIAHNSKMKPGCIEFMGTMSILIAALAWVWYYMYFMQEVLPEYQWDVREVCTDYIARRFNVSAR